MPTAGDADGEQPGRGAGPNVIGMVARVPGRPAGRPDNGGESRTQGERRRLGLRRVEGKDPTHHDRYEIAKTLPPKDFVDDRRGIRRNDSNRDPGTLEMKESFAHA